MVSYPAHSRISLIYHINFLAKRKKCGQCDGCLVADCGKCIYCKDMRRFGGPGRKKKGCMLKKCTGNVSL